MVGLPLSGKSTWIDEYMKYPGTHYHMVCPDDIRLGMGREFDLRIEPFVWAVAEAQVRALLERGLDVVVDATNMTRWERKRWSDLGRQYGAELIAYRIGTMAEECIERAKKDDREYMVPIIEKMAGKYQWLNGDEGFERIYINAKG